MSHLSDPSLLQLWTERFEQFRQNEQTVAQFCRSVGCSVATFYYWKRKIELATSPTSPEPSEKPSAFVPVVVRGTGSPCIRIRMKEGAWIAVPIDALAALKIILRHTQRVA